MMLQALPIIVKMSILIYLLGLFPARLYNIRLPLRSRGVSGNRHVLAATTYEVGEARKEAVKGGLHRYDYIIIRRKMQSVLM